MRKLDQTDEDILIALAVVLLAAPFCVLTWLWHGLRSKSSDVVQSS